MLLELNCVIVVGRSLVQLTPESALPSKGLESLFVLT
jgi:hypothetical protein